MNSLKGFGIETVLLCLLCVCNACIAGTVEGTCWTVNFHYPYGVAIDKGSNIYVIDSNNNTIHKISQAGEETTFAGIAGSKGYSDGIGKTAKFDSPGDIATDNAGNVYVADSGNRIIRKISPTGVVTTLAGTAGVTGHADGTGAAASFKSPRGIATDTSGNIYVADSYNNTIRKISPAGMVTTLAGTAEIEGHADGIGTAATFGFPSDVAVDTAGNVYVTDSVNNIIRKITSAGVVSTLAGTAGKWGSVDGTGADARFNHPNGIATDSTDNVWVAETNSGRIRKITPAGVVTTLAASFINPDSVATDNAGNIYVTDTANKAVCKLPLMKVPYVGEKTEGSKKVNKPHTMTAPVRIQVHGTHERDNIVYHYKVINNSGERLNDFVIGSTVIGNTVEGMVGEEIPQLERIPTGWKYGQEGETGTEIILAPTSTKQPPYWASDFYGQQESGNYYLKWETTPDGLAYAIPPGQSLAGFSVTVPLYDPNEAPRDYYNAAQVVDGEQDDIYLTGSFKVNYWDTSKNELKNVWGPVEIVDTTPPTLSVTLSPDTLHQTGKYVPITATIKVKDDYDPQPVIKLLSITSNEPIDKDDIKAKLLTDDRHFQLKAEHDGKSHAGRIYTATYFATDGSGNQTEASATVTVPHERREHEDRRDDKDKKDKDEHKLDH